MSHCFQGFVRLLLTTSGAAPFMGFILQARDPATDRPIGTFVPSASGPDAQPMECREANDTMTHYTDSAWYYYDKEGAAEELVVGEEEG